MPDFWLATYDVDPTIPPSGSPAEPLIAEGASTLAVEVIRKDSELAVLFSSASDAADPRSLACRIGFVNGAKTCSVWRDRGFPLLDADIWYENGRVKVVSSYFTDDESMQYGKLLVEIYGVDFGKLPEPGGQFTAHYEQAQETPDPVAPADVLLRQRVRWEPLRSSVKPIPPKGLKVEVSGSRSPNLKPFDSTTLHASRAWSGYLDLPPPDPVIVDPAPKRCSREDIFGVPAFRFESVEVIGFRLDLDKTPAIDAGLRELIKPLNFHAPPGSPADFRYRAATRMVLVELLRYGRMQLKSQDEPLTRHDFQSQHELVVRLLVGRVDHDAAQAQDAAVYVPAIFVDNPWSKILGRDVQGFDKRMADFCTAGGRPLRPDGRPAQGAERTPLSDIATIRLVERTKTGSAGDGPPLVSFDYLSPPDDSWEDFQRVALDVALGGIPGARWRATDFDLAEFRRSFALSAITDSMRGFRSIQVSPVGKKIDALGKAWITSTFRVDDDMEVAYPSGGVQLTFHRSDAAPGPWKEFCKLLGAAEGGVARRSFQTGSWYRLKFSMNMTVDDGLGWD